MRHPERIDEFCDKLRAVWKDNPDLRFGQLVMNIYQLSGNTSFFYLEDDVALQIMKDGTERWTYYERD